MALHIKSTKTFKFLIGGSAILISAMAATFSITGIASLFSGYFLTVALMMGSLEFSKIVVASYLSRYWNEVTTLLKTYFIFALIILILITSGGIFGYLSDAYQKTKGDYSIVEKQVEILKVKQNSFIERKNRLLDDRKLQLNSKKSSQARMDSLTVRGQNINRTRTDISDIDKSVSQLDKNISISEDSISYYDVKILELESKNIQGELGPLKYIAVVFNTSMDIVVKYFIFLLIFVFDPLAILLFVSLNSLIKKESFNVYELQNKSYNNNITNETIDKNIYNDVTTIDTDSSSVPQNDFSVEDNNTIISEKEPVNILDESTNDIKKKEVLSVPANDMVEYTNKNIKKDTDNIKIEDDFVNTLVEEFNKTSGNNKEHDFYHTTPVSPSNGITKKSSNYHVI